MGFPAFFDQVPRIVMFDPLAQFLGAVPDGRMEYTYADAVKLAGHSCPTVASAYLMAIKGIAALYGDQLPERGAIRVSFKGDRNDGTNGVVANVFTLLTGASGDEGFKGLGGKFHRNGLMTFNASIRGEVRLANSDRAVDVSFNAPASLAGVTRALLQAAMQPGATPGDREAFAVAFQSRVKQILVDRRDDPSLVIISPV